MTLDMLATFVQQALLLVLVFSIPTVLVPGLVGLVMAFLQAVTQIQDQTITFSIKLMTLIVALVLSAGWLGSQLYNYANRLLATIPNVS
ncbi:MAG: type III secretion system export apparatus subunit SctS [Ectothiorhodospiraceae bacterium]|nr:type III secretion system export apparatus subunit SctS [Ectothiorhodospiraceae bacterium]MCH8503883.1 type III secretion system export apparatus subunit SctS [Ectothiorhodospiraceae bacterium]